MIDMDAIWGDYLARYRKSPPPPAVRQEAARRVLDSIGCFLAAFDHDAVRILREVVTADVSGPSSLWGTARRVPFETAAWVNGAGVRALDYNDTYLSREPCHPSDLLSSVWAACEARGGAAQGRRLIESLVLGYEILCRLCDAASIRARGWDHVTYLPIASAMACARALDLTPAQAVHAVALAATPQSALRQTRVGAISDWKAACAAHAARAGLWAAMLARAGFTGPSQIFTGRHGFFHQVSGPLRMPRRLFEGGAMILRTHVKFHPAEHHAQGAIEAAAGLAARRAGRRAAEIVVETFGASVDIIGSEPEKWRPETRETADHSLPYLVAVAYLDGTVSLSQYERGRHRAPDVRALMRRIRVRRAPDLEPLYPRMLPVRLLVRYADGSQDRARIDLPKGYAGRPLSTDDALFKFRSCAGRRLPASRVETLAGALLSIERAARLSEVAALMRVSR